ncbi:MAG: VanZ family protein [Plectolyngbya sp. WJT66-NPBG17]|jgi:glycopeptide antibiotics resistance protein|nr:VanZ family protein [Plectolyngbya sp. WJT66-NPBG17]MBW4527654.1 VanZ family protein [Phormidium tanganyikae FI6-MK23]
MSYSSPRRSIFITLSSVLLVVLVTLLPFNFTAEGITFESAIRRVSTHASGMSDLVGNIFLFLPFGIDLAYEFRQRRINKRLTLLFVLGLSALLSTTVETLQVFLPWRSPSVIDVLTNTSGGAIGAIVYFLWQQALPSGAEPIAIWIRRRLSPQMLAGLSILWLVVASGICFVLQQDLKIGTWHFPIAFMFIFYGVFFVPLGILLALITSVLKGELKFYLILSVVGVILPALIIEVLLRGTDLRKVNLLVSITISLFTMLVFRGRLGHLLRY